MSEITLDSVVTAAKAQVSCDLGGEMAILNTHTGVYYGLDAVGARIWTLLQDRRIVVRDIERQILQEFDVEPDRCQQDLLSLLQGLASEGLLEVA